ncbi:unnamed protein product [Owenia fusiformis]|uniref:Elongator complex protein 4 n=1 Tax=Owenia fusiformis TaxID=6347 RepID=A0A8J1XTJ0_OWEFU|nr:unnamed protein product [Owenia fusiformis]
MYSVKMAATSFQKKSRSKLFNIPGTRPSLHNNQLLISTGIPSLDNILGGGTAVGTVVLIEEDTYGSFSNLMLKYFLAEGVMTNQTLFLATANESPDNILKDLPAPIVDDPGASGNMEGGQEGGTDEKMKIAWRYQHLPQFQSNPTNVRFGHYYDLTKTMETDLRTSVESHTVDVTQELRLNPEPSDHFINCSYRCLLRAIQKRLAKGYTTTDTTQIEKHVMRIGIQSLGSPQWRETRLGSETSADKSMLKFLYALRSLVRSSFATCVLTVPTQLFQDEVFTSHIERLCDTVVNLESFAGTNKETNPAYKEYHGLFHIKALPRLNALNCHMPDTLDLAFKLKRKKFTIEKLHLPPELSETSNKEQNNAIVRPSNTTSCGTGITNSKLDF